MKAGHEPTKLLSDIDCGAFNHAFYASRPLPDTCTCTLYIHVHTVQLSDKVNEFRRRQCTLISKNVIKQWKSGTALLLNYVSFYCGFNNHNKCALMFYVTPLLKR